MTNVWLTISIEKKATKKFVFPNHRHFYMFWMKFECTKWDVWSYIELWRWNTHIKWRNNCKAYLIMWQPAVDTIFSRKCIVQKKTNEKRMYEPMRRSENAFVDFYCLFLVFKHYTKDSLAKRPNIIKNILPVFFSCSFLHRIRAILEHGTTQA